MEKNVNYGTLTIIILFREFRNSTTRSQDSLVLTSDKKITATEFHF